MHNFLTPSLVVGTFLSLITGFLLLVFDVTDFGMSLTIGLVGTTLAAAVDLIDRSEYAAVFRAPPWLRHEVARLGQAAQGVLAHGVPALDDELQAVVTRAAGDVEMLANGRMERSGPASRHMLGLTVATTRRIAAVTMVNERYGNGSVDWWSSEFGRRYWQANVDALERGVVIDRVFIHEKLGQGLRDLAEVQRAAGVNVYLLEADQIAPTFRTNAVIWDDTCTWEARLDAYGNVTGNLFSYSPLDVARLHDLVDTAIVQAHQTATPGP